MPITLRSHNRPTADPDAPPSPASAFFETLTTPRKKRRFRRALVMLAAFVWTELHAAEPIMPLSLFGSRRFVGITLLTLLLYGALGGFFVLVPYVLTQDRETIRHQHGRACTLHETGNQ